MSNEWFINIDDCCGCSACEQICPTRCITMQENAEGFLIPRKDTAQCIDCHLCENVCLVNKPFESQSQDAFTPYMCRTLDSNLLEASSSGGLFTHLATSVINRGGVVYGAAFDSSWNVKHIGIETLDDLHLLRGSKYVASDLGTSYAEVKKHLSNNRVVLFTGTPCQISGLNHYLRREYDNLITVDIMCHGVPSPSVWQRYLAQNTNNISNITFRSKFFGWNKYALKISCDNIVHIHESHKENIFMRGFLNNLYNRTSCSNCPSRGFNTQSDIMLGDFWELDCMEDPHLDNRGMSLILVFTQKGRDVLDTVRSELFIQEIDFSQVTTRHMHDSLYKSAPKHMGRSVFFQEFAKHTNINKLIEKLLSYPKISIKKRFLRFTKPILRKLKLMKL